MGRNESACLAGILLLSSWAPAQAQEHRLLVVHSYHTGYEWVQGLDRAIDASLEGFPGLEVQRVYLDTKRRSSPGERAEAGRRALETLAAFGPEVVIAADDNAQELVVRPHLGKRSPQFVFAGVNAAPETYGFPAPNVTGILERTYPSQVLEILTQIAPGIEAVALVTDRSATSNLLLTRFRSAELPLQIASWDQPEHLEDWQATVRRVDADPSVGAFLVPLYHTLSRQSDGSHVPPSEVMRWTVEHTQKPVVGLWPFAVTDGAVCAVVVDSEEHGRRAGALARELLGGGRAGDLPLETNQEGAVHFNLISAQRLGLEIPFDLLEVAGHLVEPE